MQERRAIDAAKLAPNSYTQRIGFVATRGGGIVLDFALPENEYFKGLYVGNVAGDIVILGKNNEYIWLPNRPAGSYVAVEGYMVVSGPVPVTFSDGSQVNKSTTATDLAWVGGV